MAPISTFAVSTDAMEEPAEMPYMDTESLADKMAHHNEMHDAGEGNDFHRPSMASPAHVPFYGCELLTDLHDFDGGLPRRGPA